MVTFSCCMIVKNEETVLARCLDSICDLMDEIIIVDTGSTDSTKEIAKRYTDKIYDFEWIDDFSAARNFSFEKATMDYIYVPDADEYLDFENHRQFALLKQFLDPNIEIVQMMYDTISKNTVLNIQKEYRPKLFKRLRTYTWIDPIHETVRLDPLVFDSDIVITHAPEHNHSKRDFNIFQVALKRDKILSKKVSTMYATELIKQGTLVDFVDAKDYFQEMFETSPDETLKIQAACVLVRYARITKNKEMLMRLLPEYPAAGTTSEICYDFGMYYLSKKEYTKAIDWLRVAINDVSYALDVHTCGDEALKALCECYTSLIEQKNLSEEESKMYYSELSIYKKMLSQWNPPEEHH